MHTEQTIKTLRSVFQFLNGVPEANELIQESCPGITNNEEEEEEVYSLRRKIRTEKTRRIIFSQCHYLSGSKPRQRVRIHEIQD